jgi:hypothetical protein
MQGSMTSVTPPTRECQIMVKQQTTIASTCVVLSNINPALKHNGQHGNKYVEVNRRVYFATRGMCAKKAKPLHLRVVLEIKKYAVIGKQTTLSFVAHHEVFEVQSQCVRCHVFIHCASSIPSPFSDPPSSRPPTTAYSCRRDSSSLKLNGTHKTITGVATTIKSLKETPFAVQDTANDPCAPRYADPKYEI